MLQEFLNDNRAEILALSAEKTKLLAGTLMSSEQLDQGLPIFYEQLIKFLNQKLGIPDSTEMLKTAASHGKESLALGYTLSHVVHAYGAMCQAITELATRKNAEISPSNFNILNGCLDIAIASAVTEFQFQTNAANEIREIKHLGFLAHELRNALSSATVAQEMIKAGIVGVGGSTASVLDANLSRMRNLIDRSLSEVRMRADSDLYIQKFQLSEMLDQIIVTAKSDAEKRHQTIQMDVKVPIELEADRQFLLSGISNLLQNAIKYSKTGAKIWIRGSMEQGRVLIAIEDECGGIAEDKLKTIFSPYVSGDKDRSGLGLGLAIAQKAIQLSQGSIKVSSKPGLGWVFTIDIPQSIEVKPSNKTAVHGVDSVQPTIKKVTE